MCRRRPLRSSHGPGERSGQFRLLCGSAPSTRLRTPRQAGFPATGSGAGAEPEMKVVAAQPQCADGNLDREAVVWDTAKPPVVVVL